MFVFKQSLFYLIMARVVTQRKNQGIKHGRTRFGLVRCGNAVGYISKNSVLVGLSASLSFRYLLKLPSWIGGITMYFAFACLKVYQDILSKIGLMI
jgi:hypothetical protein